MTIDKAELAKIKEAAADILLSIGKIESAILAREAWPGGPSIVVFSLGEVAGSANLIRDTVARIIGAKLASRPGKG